MINRKVTIHGEVGQTILEVILAFGVSIIVLTAIILSVMTALRNAEFAKNQGLANSYALEGMTVVRKTRDSTSWNDFNARNGDYCLPQNATVLGNNDSNCAINGVVGTSLVRSAKLEPNSNDCKADPACVTEPCLKGSRAMVIVSWNDNKCTDAGNPRCHKVELVSCFSNMDQ